MNRFSEYGEQLSLSFGPQEPPNDYRIYNRRRSDGSFPSVRAWFERAADALEPEPSIPEPDSEREGER